jgi:hypothetical protein
MSRHGRNLPLATEKSYVPFNPSTEKSYVPIPFGTPAVGGDARGIVADREG